MRRSTSFCCATIELVLPHSQLRVSFSMSSCCSGRYGWKNASCTDYRPSIWDQQLYIRPVEGAAHLAKEVEREPGVGHHALRVGRPELGGLAERRRALGEGRRAAVVEVL